MFSAAVVFVYLAIVLYVGIFAFRRSTSKAEDFFVANRSLGTFVFLLSLFGSNMTSFALLGSSGLAFRQGIGVFGLMASISAIIIPMSIFLIGTRIWAIGKKFGHMTQVQIFRDRWQMGHIGTVIFVLQALMLVPYIIIGVMGGGETLEGISDRAVPYWFGGAIVALVVMGYVFFGGMRGTAWVNTIQTTMFLLFGTITFFVIARGMGGLGPTVEKMLAGPAQVDARVSGEHAGTAAPGPETRNPKPGTPSPQPRGDAELLTRARVSPGLYFSYLFIPLSSIMFPHIAIFCLTAKRMSSFRKTVIFYPLCIMAIWLPAVFLGAIATTQPQVVAHMAAGSEEATRWLEARGGVHPDGKPAALKLTEILRTSDDPKAGRLLQDVSEGAVDEAGLSGRLVEINDTRLKPELRRLANGNSDGAMLALLHKFSPAWLAGLLGAAIMACVMASDSQILALSTMWAEDVYAFYGGKKRFGEAAQVWSARAFVVVITVIAYVIAIAVHEYENIFDLAIQYAFSGYASMAPIMLACLFWKRSTKWGAFWSTVWVAGTLVGVSVLQAMTTGPRTPAAAPVVIWSIGDTPILLREYSRVSFTAYRFLMVLPMFVGAAMAMVIGSLLTSPPDRQTLERYFPQRHPQTVSQEA